MAEPTATGRAMEALVRVADLEAAIAEHRAAILMDGGHQFDINEADEKLWRLITPVANDEEEARP